MSTPLLQQFPSLSSYPSSFLKDLLSSPELVEAFLFTLPEVQELAAEIERLGRENEEIARQNLNLREELLSLRDATARSYAHAEALKQQWEEIDKAQKNLYSRQRPSFLHLRLKHSITAQDEESEKIAKAFIEGYDSGIASGIASRVDSPAPSNGGNETPVNGSASRLGGGERVRVVLLGLTFGLESLADMMQGHNKAVEEFMTEFKAARKTYHKRAIWAERWSRGEVAWTDD